MNRPLQLPLLVILLLLAIRLCSAAAAAACGVYSDDRCDDVAAAPPVDLSSHPLPYSAVRGTTYTVSSDERAITINGQRVLLQSGIIHYPRSTPAMWPSLLRNLRLAHLNTVQTYVFWNYHELAPGQWDFHSESRNLSHFISLAEREGLFVNLRFGPYVCAESDPKHTVHDHLYCRS